MITNIEKMRSGIFRIAWGYIFIYFNININAVSLLPAFVGYGLFLSAIGLLQDEERELSLLKPLVGILLVWNAADWVLSWMGSEAIETWFLLDLLTGLINLYFQFQFLTNLASIAAKYQEPDRDCDTKLLTYRTWQTIMLTIVMLIGILHPWLSEIWGYVSIGIGIVYILFGICLIKTLFELRNALRTDESFL